MDLITSLNGPELVVKFQKYFGVIPRKSNVESHHNQYDAVLSSNGSTKCESNGNHANGHASNGKNGYTTVRNGSSDVHHRNGNGSQNGLSNGCADPVAIEKQNEEQKNKFVTDEYVITNRFFYYLFHFGANLGNEIFYITFYPFWIWNIDGFVGRRVCIFWALFMYIGQATKDILKIPRPASPPVMRMEKLYALEYGMPSTHAMVGAGFPFTILLLTWQRYVYPVEYGFLLATGWTLLVCCSRLYLGMHSVLDVLAGLLYVFALMPVYMLSVDHLDDFILHNPSSLLFCIGVPITLCLFYPKLERWSTARGDTTVIVSVASGMCAGSHLAYQTGFMHHATTVPSGPIVVDQLTMALVTSAFVRLVIGVVIVVATRAVMKFASLKTIGYITQIDVSKKENLQLLSIELFTKFTTYFSMAIVTIWIVPLVFCLFNVQRDSYFHEL